QMQTDMLATKGPAISEAIYMAANCFDEAKTNHLLVLISDGEDHEMGIAEALQQAKDKKIKILTSGVGTEQGSTIPVKIGGQTQAYLRDLNNEVVITRMNDKVLKEIAAETKGKYVLGNNSKQATDTFKSLLDTIE